jgi:dTDP-4-dehydrorhamnose 3,5-epimerase
MNALEGRIEGVIVTLLRQINDERGTVLHMLRNDSPEFTRFGECYFSEILPNAVKAWKCHRAQIQIKELGRPDAYLRLRIPPGLWYGFACLGETPALLANCVDLPHDANESELRQINDPDIPYQW